MEGCRFGEQPLGPVWGGRANDWRQTRRKEERDRGSLSADEGFYVH